MSETEIQAEPVVLEYGRYRMFQAPDGGLVIARAVHTCDTCQSCGCGTQADPVGPIPAVLVKVMRGEPVTAAERLSLITQLGPVMKGLMSSGR